MKTLHKTLLSLVFIAPVLCFFTIFLISPWLIDYMEQTDFNSYEWKKAEIQTEENSSLRWKMRKDLIQNYQLLDKASSEIYYILGHTNNSSPLYIQYDLGPSGFGINHGTLHFELNQDTVIKYSIHKG